MRAVVQSGIGGTDVLSLDEVTAPSLDRGDVLIRASAIGVNFHDVEIRRRGDRGKPIPHTPGTDVAGTVEAVAPDVTSLRVGQRVVALVRLGAYAEVVKAHSPLVTPIPDGVDDAVAAAVPVPGLTAYFLRRDHIPPSAEYAVVHSAAGGVGCWLGALLRDTPTHAVGVVSTAAKARIARDCGYSSVVDTSSVSDPVRAVLDATRRRGADVVFDSKAGDGLAGSFRALRPGGTVVLFGRSGGPPSLAGLDEHFLGARRNLGLRTFFLSRTLLGEMAAVQTAFAELFEVIAQQRLTLPITEMPLAAAGEAHRLLEGRGTVGKVVLRP